MFCIKKKKVEEEEKGEAETNGPDARRKEDTANAFCSSLL